MSDLQHIAITMDGNRRWAKSKGLTTFEGHKIGAKNGFKIVESVIKLNVKHLTLYCCSYENLYRSQIEVEGLKQLLNYYLTEEIKQLQKLGIKLKFIGEIEKFGTSLHKAMLDAEEISKDNDKINLYLAFGYGSRMEIVKAAKKMASSGIDISSINEAEFSKFMYAPNMPEVDLFIRPGNQSRVSNFLLWQSAYAELYFSKKLWPDFNEDDLRDAIEEYKYRDRTFGS